MSKVEDKSTTGAVSTTMEDVGSDMYVLKYPQQACEWSDYTEGQDWMMYLQDDSVDAATCAEGCIATDGCTGFEVALSGFTSGPYCAFWLNGACTVPDESMEGKWTAGGGEVEVNTYTLTLPIDAFVEYENSACAWAYYIEGEDWAFATKDTDDASACAELCLDSMAAADGGCTGFEVGSSTSTEFGDLSNGYCALWYNNTCAPTDMLPQRTHASTYLLVNAYNFDRCNSHFFYAALLVACLLACLGICCCCRRAMMRRRRLALMRAAAAGTRVAARAAPNAAPSATVAVEGCPASRAVVYAVRVEDEDEEPSKV